MKTATEEQVRAQFCVHDIKEALQEIREMQDKEWTQETALDMLTDIMETLKERASETGESIEDLDFVARMTWVTKEAFIGGFLKGCMICFESNEMGMQALFGGA